MSYQLVPPLAPDDYARLRASIQESGVQYAIVVDEHGEILDGHHRQAIADELGIDCPRVVRTGLSEHDKRILSVMLNLARRQLTDAQKVMLGRQIEPDIKQRAEERRIEKLRKGDVSIDSPMGSNDPNGEFPESPLSVSLQNGAITIETKPSPRYGQMSTTGSSEQGKTRELVAKAVGLGSGSTYQRAKQAIEFVEREVPELLPKIETGEIDLPQIRQEIKRRQPANPMAREFERAADEAIANADPESLEAFGAMLVESQELPVTAEHLATAITLLSRADREFRHIRPELMERLLSQEPDEIPRLERAIELLTTMLSRCRGWGGKRSHLRRVV